MDGRLVGGHIGLGVGFGGGGLAQHVVGVAEPLGFVLAGVGQRFLDGLAGDELLAHHPHAQVHALAHQRLAALLEDAGERRSQLVLAVGAHQPAGDDQAPGGGVDEDGRGLAHVGLPVAMADLVTDERIACFAVGNAQQRLGQAHQCYAFLAGEREFLDQRLDAAGARPGTQSLAEATGQLVHPHLEAGVGQRGVLGLGQQPGDTFGFGAAPGGRDGGAARGLRRHLLSEGHEGRRGLAADALGKLGRIGAGGGQLVGRLLAAFDGFQVADQRLSGQPLKTAVVAISNVLQAVVQCFVDLDVERGRTHVFFSDVPVSMVGRPPAGIGRVATPGGAARSPPDPVQPMLGVQTANPTSKNASVSFFLRNIPCLIFRRIGICLRVMDCLSLSCFSDFSILFPDHLEHENHHDRAAGHRAGRMAGRSTGPRCRASGSRRCFAGRGPGFARDEHGADPGQPGTGHPARRA